MRAWVWRLTRMMNADISKLINEGGLLISILSYTFAHSKGAALPSLTWGALRDKSNIKSKGGSFLILSTFSTFLHYRIASEVKIGLFSPIWQTVLILASLFVPKYPTSARNVFILHGNCQMTQMYRILISEVIIMQENH